MQKKRIAIISYHTCPLASEEGKETGGMNVYVLELAKALSHQGYSIDIFTRSQDVNNIPVVQLNKDLRVVHLPAGPQKPCSKKKVSLFVDEFVKNYFSFVSKENALHDLIHSHYYLSGIIGEKIKKTLKKKIPHVVSFHTVALMKNLVARSHEEKEEQFRIHEELKLVQQADRIITSSETESLYMQYLYDSPAEKLRVIPPGIDIKHFHPINKTVAKKKVGLPLNKKFVLFVGRIEPLKGIDTLIYAMKIIVKRHPHIPITLVIVGGDVSQKKNLWASELKKLEEIRRTLHIPNIVTFVGQRRQEELPYFYNSADVLVMPSHYESFGIVALEAMACGTPVITSNVSGIATLLDEQHASLITTVNNPLLLASQIERLVFNEKVHEKVSKHIITGVKNLTWQTTAKKISQLYKAL